MTKTYLIEAFARLVWAVTGAQWASEWISEARTQRLVLRLLRGRPLSIHIL